jgi:hypothetical protein
MLDVARSKHLDYFRTTLDSLKADGRDAYAEICLDLTHREVRDDLYRLYVVDILERSPDGSSSVIECNIDPIEISSTILPLGSPIAWNGIEFFCDPELFSEPLLLSWANRWITDENPPFGPQDGFTGIIHSVTGRQRGFSALLRRFRQRANGRIRRTD